jgi:DDE superfamily endonuclease
MKPTRQDYCQFILATQINYTQTYFAEHHKYFSHDAINKYMVSDNVRPSEVWKRVKDNIEFTPDGAIIFDDTVINKEYAKHIEAAQVQYSGNVHGLVNGVGVVNCVYVNTKTDESWIIDWRIFNPKKDKKTKLQHAVEMFDNAINCKKLPFSTVLMDTWYATKELMLHFSASGKVFYCPLRSNRKVDDSDGKVTGKKAYKSVDSLTWSDKEAEYGKIVKVHEFPGDTKLKLFRVVATDRTEWIVTNDLTDDEVAPPSEDKPTKDVTDPTQKTASDARKACALRWKIEQYHREVKQTLGFEKCQCRKLAAQKTHIGCVVLVWHFLTKIAKDTGKTIYAVKNKLLSGYMKRELTNPTLAMPNV